ncbi:MAG: hypothetical protein ACK5LL_08840 [Suipraeoptans sp.]
MSFHTIATALWVTLGYILIWAMIVICLVQEISSDISFNIVVLVIIVAIGVYFVILVGYIIFANQYYTKRHKQARTRVRGFNKSLIRLLRMYEREKRNNGKSINS